MNRPIEFYVAILAAAAYVFETNNPKPFKSRFMITMVSAGLGFSIAPDVAQYIGSSLVITGMMVTALGFLALETTSALISDIPFIKGIVQKRLGS